MSPPAAAAAVPTSSTSSDSTIRRSFTLPARIARRPQPASSSTASADGIETLFVCTSTRIVSFTATAPSRQASSSLRQAAQQESIPYRSSTERTLAVGVLRIYRVTSSNVSFLNSGNLLHTIFPKSQCWCVDGQSVFVLRVRQDNYYRIELPYESEEDKQKVEDLKSVLAQVLQYEKTRCPFRESEAELPERPPSPPRRRQQKAPEKAKKWMFDKTWMPENGLRPSTPVLEGSDSGTISSYEEDDRSSINTDVNEPVTVPPASLPPTAQPKAAPLPSVRERAMRFQGLRTVSAPLEPKLTRPSLSQPRDSRASLWSTESLSQDKENGPREYAETQSMISSADSFETARQRSPSPEFLDAEDGLTNPWLDEHGSQREQEEERGRLRHRRQLSQVTVRPRSAGQTVDTGPRTPTIENSVTTPTIDVQPPSVPSTPPLMSDSDEDSIEPAFSDISTPPDTIRLKRLTGASQRRAYSPMPSPQNLFRPANSVSTKHLTTALVRKTCELLLGPPAHLVTLMLNIAARISEGAFGFSTYRVRHSGEKIPCSWESSDDEDEWDEDDYGIPLSNLQDSALRRKAYPGDVD